MNLSVFALALAVAVGVAPEDHASRDINDYLLDPEMEVVLARSAGQGHVSGGATIHVLRPNGYEVAVEGDNGFHCMVLRSWAGPRRSYDTRVSAPICFNPQAADSVVPVKVFLSQQVAAGVDLEDLGGIIDRRLAGGDFKLPAPGAFAYMLSGNQWLNERAQNWRPHLMFYAPDVSNDDVGGNGIQEGLPVVVGGETGNYGNITVPLPARDFIWAETLDRAVLEHPSRTDADRAQDEGRRALEVYEWLGLRPGMHVADVFAGTGYNTQLLGLALGEESRIHSVIGFFADTFKERFGTDFVAEVESRVASAELRNVTVHSTLDNLPDGALDAVVSIRNFHDVQFFGGDPEAALANLQRALRPGGIVGVVEVSAAVPGWDADAHRMGEESVVAAFTSAGFELVARSEMLANPDDDRSSAAFDVGRHTMDRYLLKFRKATAS